MKKNTLLALFVGMAFLFSAHARAHGAIVWGDTEYEFFRYAVDNNGGFFFKEPSDFQEANPKDSSTNAEGESGNFEDTVSTHVGEIEPNNPTIELDAWAQGTGTPQSPPDGLQVKGYAQITLSGFNPTDSGVDVTQTVVAWVTRRFTVDQDGTYDLSASLNGTVDFNVFGNAADKYFSSYSVTAAASIDAFKASNGEPVENLPWNIPDLSLIAQNGDGGARNGDTEVYLLKTGFQGEDVVYELRVVLTIQARLQNLSLVGDPHVTTPPGNTDILGTYTLGEPGGPLDFLTSLTYSGPLPDQPYFMVIPRDTTVACRESTHPADTGTAQAITNCDDLNVAWSDSSSPGAGGTRVITRTWTATACSGTKATSIDQIITVQACPDPGSPWLMLLL